MQFPNLIALLQFLFCHHSLSVILSNYCKLPAFWISPYQHRLQSAFHSSCQKHFINFRQEEHGADHKALKAICRQQLLLPQPSSVCISRIRLHNWRKLIKVWLLPYDVALLYDGREHSSLDPKLQTIFLTITGAINSYLISIVLESINPVIKYSLQTCSLEYHGWADQLGSWHE